MSISSRYSLIAAIFIMLILASGQIGFAFTLADSEDDFSNVQGQDNWYYGFYDGDSESPFTNDPYNDDFEQLDIFANDVWQLAPIGNYWTFVASNWGHPSGTSASRVDVLHWSVRRYISEADGLVNIEGILAKRDPSCGNGIIGHIFIDGEEVYSQYIEYNDTLGVEYSIDVPVSKGSVIDFAIDPRASNELCDSTTFTVVIGPVCNNKK